jgi:hypothetical protein
MQEYFVLALAGATSALAVALGVIGLRLPLRALPGAVGKALEAVGLAIVFGSLNVVLGAALLLLARALTGQFFSLYHASDVALVICSALQALVFQAWRGATARPPALASAGAALRKPFVPEPAPEE